ncbi:MAG: class I SAM-dependent methyltransferase [Gammaproteobacteria bacterium]|nr:MAG: class I SAM-dependent methyltransferase [Gammaproteobacteria bacterium]
MSTRTIGLDDRLYDYLLSVSLRDSELLARLRAETARDAMARMQVSPEQGQFMALLVELIGARTTLELGVFTGYSSLCVALTLPDDGRIVACDVSERWTDVGRRYWKEAGVEHKIDLRIAPALETLDSLVAEGRAGSFDFAFIDADKGNYLEYYERCLTLVCPGGLIAVDNTLWSGAVADAADEGDDTLAIRALNEHIHADERVTMSLLPIADGLTLAVKR